MLNYEVAGEGKTTIVYRAGEKAIKLYTNAAHNEVLKEAKKQAFAVDAGLPVPKVYGVTEMAEGIALEMEYIAGHALIQPKMDRLERNAALEKLVELQCMVHAVNADGLPRQADILAWKLERAPGLDKATVARLLSLLDALDCGETNLCHGDFHVSNILKADDTYWIIDWVDASSGCPLADACRTYLIFRQYISRMAGVYLRLFCAKAGVGQDEVLAWLPIVAAARLSENLSEKEHAGVMEMAGL